MKVRIPHLRGRTELLEGSKVFVDPAYSPQFFIERLDVLPLLVDKVMVYEPSKANLKKWNYPIERFCEFVREGIFVPLFIERPIDIDVNEKQCLFRTDLLEDFVFLREYDKAVSEDLEDREFEKLALNACGGNSKCVTDLIYSINWDIIVSQILETPIFINEDLKPLWKYKYEKTIRDISRITNTPELVDKSHIVKKFLYLKIHRLPMNLSIDEVKEFRKEKVATEFRRWLKEVFSRMVKEEEFKQVRPERDLLERFEELANTYRRKTQITGALIGGAIGVALSSLGANFAGIPSTIISLLTLPLPYAFIRIIRKMWKLFGPNNWVFLLLDLEKKRG